MHTYAYTCILYITHFRIHVYFTLLISVYTYTLHYSFPYTCILYITHFRIHVYFTLLIFVYMYTLHYSNHNSPISISSGGDEGGSKTEISEINNGTIIRRTESGNYMYICKEQCILKN